MCADHFTDDCFADPNRTKLKKTSRPIVQYPLPTIFKSNLHKYFTEKRSKVSNETNDDNEDYENNEKSSGSEPTEYDHRELKSLKIQTVHRKRRSNNDNLNLKIPKLVNVQLDNETNSIAPLLSVECFEEVEESFPEKYWQDTAEGVLIEDDFGTKSIEKITEFPVLYEEHTDQSINSEYAIVVEENNTIFDEHEQSLQTQQEEEKVEAEMDEEEQINELIEYQDSHDEICRLCSQSSTETNQFYKLFVEDDPDSVNLTENVQKLLPNMVIFVFIKLLIV